MEAFDAVLEIGLLVITVCIVGYAVRLIFTTVRGTEETRMAARAARGTVIELRGNVEARIPTAEALGDADVSEALRVLTRAVLEEPTLPDRRRVELAEVLLDLSSAATAPVEERTAARITAEVELLGSVARSSPGFGVVWSTWGPVVSHHLLPPP